MEIKVLGAGCPKCRKLSETAQEVIKENVIEATLTKVEDILQIIDYNVLRLPALVIDEKVVSQGQLLSKEKVKKLLIP